LLRGEVDDENAFILGGVAGHAGLFGTAVEVHRVLGALAAAYTGNSAGKGFSPETVRCFLEPGTPGERALGFDRPAVTGASCGRLFDTAAVGHLGFTGTSFWMDPASGRHVVLLSNRGHPFRYAQGIQDFRPVLHDAVRIALEKIECGSNGESGDPDMLEM
jgi:CubicO group peptidase (beta-lactamase class C family)